MNSGGINNRVTFTNSLGPDHALQNAGLNGLSTQLQSSGLVAHENSTLRNLALAVSVLSIMA